MIRFVDLRYQIEEGTHYFAFFDTVSDTFVTLNGSQIWSAYYSFREDWDSEVTPGWDIRRFTEKIPTEFN